MEYLFKLQIDILKKEDISKLEEIICLKGNGINENQWSYEIEIEENDEWVDFIFVFYKALYGKFRDLQKLNISKEDITIWFYHAYKQQCNIEFNAIELKKLGSLGVALCISCWEK